MQEVDIMTLTTTTAEMTASRKTPHVGNTTSKRKNTKTVTIKKDVITTVSKKTPNALKATKTTSAKTTKTLSTTQLSQKVAELEATVTTLIEVLNNEFRTEMLQGPRGVSKSLSKAGLLKDS
jgi:hypothetical protein